VKSPVQLYLRVRLPDGSYPYLKAAFAANGRLRPDHAIHSGRAAEFPGASYHLRYRLEGKRVWEPVGNEPSLALTRLQQKVRDLQHVGDHADDTASRVVAETAAPTHPVTEQPKTPLLLNDAIEEYLAEVKTHKSAKTYAAYRTTLYLFSPDAAKEATKNAQSDVAPVTVFRCKAKKPAAEISRQFANKPLCEVSRRDLLDYIEFLDKQKKSVPRTIHNRVDFFKFFSITTASPRCSKAKTYRHIQRRRSAPTTLASSPSSSLRRRRMRPTSSTSSCAPVLVSKKHSLCAGLT
jgi:integrase/recombinase XerD